MGRYAAIYPQKRLPSWLHKPLGSASELEKVQHLIKANHLHTICEEGHCPNRGECYASGTATFLLGGSVCTRNCAFCQVDKGRAPMPVDVDEPKRVADAIAVMGLHYVVLTAVARDDLSDQGASLFAQTITAIRTRCPLVAVEVLTPDFWRDYPDHNKAVATQRSCLATVLAASPVCFGHNLETVRRLQREVRRGATYKHSLELLFAAHEIAPNIPVKSGLMLGLGETREEVIETLKDLRSVGCQRVTLGQYLRPSLENIPVARYWQPEEFEYLGAIANDLGFTQVRSGALVRSSYHAAED